MLSKHEQENQPLHSSGRLSELNQECQGGIALLPIAILPLSVAILKHTINNGKVNLPMKKLRHDARKNASMTAYTKKIKGSLYRATQPKPPGGFRQKKSRQPPTFPLSQYHRRRGAWLPCSEWERVLPPRHGHRHHILTPRLRDSGTFVRAPRASCCTAS